MSRLAPIRAAGLASWHEAPEAAALLADCAARPPAIKHRVDTYAITADHWTEFSPADPRVRALKRLWEEAYDAAAAAGEDTGPILDIPPQKAIEQAVEEHKARFAPAKRRKAA